MLHQQIADLYRPFAEALIRWFNKLQKIHIFSPYPSCSLPFLHGTTRNDVDALLWEKVKEEICPDWKQGTQHSHCNHTLQTPRRMTPLPNKFWHFGSQINPSHPSFHSHLSSPPPQETIGSLTNKFNSSSAASSTTIPKRIISIRKDTWDEQLT